ncbi:MAG: protease modulator HflC [Proteobacteria bacterium]|nr:protease modulator HflC [Pseudomonadota bacterium]
MEKLKMLLPGLAVVLLAAIYFSIFMVNERERVILFRLGEIVRSDFEPGLHFKMPVINNVRKFDARIHTAEAEPERYLTAEKKNVIVDSFVKWRIKNVADYYRSMGGDELRANQRLYQIVKDGLRGEFGKRTIKEVISGDRANIMDVLTVTANQQAHQFGIEVIDVRLRRVDLPKEVSLSVFQRMQAERERVAKDLRARGAEAAERIRADADRQRSVILAEAYREAEHMRGQGDAQAAAIYAKAFGSDAEFYSLYRSLNAYKNTFRDKGDILVLDPGADFFKYFKSPSLGGARSGGK